MRHILAIASLLLLPVFAGAGDLIYLLTSTNELVLVDSATPGTAISARPITGLADGERLLTLDFRPENGSLYGISTTGFFYRVDGATGAAVAIDAFPIEPLLAGVNLATDFDPVIDRLRVVDELNANIRVHPELGRRVAYDGGITWAPGDPGVGTTPTVVGIASSNNFIGATSSATYVIDATRDVLATMGRPADGIEAPFSGQLHTVGLLGIGTSGVVGFDIAENGTAYAMLTEGVVPRLYTISLTTGVATVIGNAARTTAIDIAVAPSERIYVLPVAGRVAGANETLFRTDVRIVNRGTTRVPVRLDFYATGPDGNSGATASTTVDIAAGAEAVFDDLLSNTFGIASGVGAVVVRSSRPVIIGSRVYNDQRAVGAGTFGQFVPAFDSNDGRRSGTFPLVANRDASTKAGYRTNVGWFNFGSTNVRLTVNALSVSGEQLAKTTLTIHGLAHQQASLAQLFPELAAADDLYLTFQVDGGSLFVYASVVDNVNGDAIFVPPY